MNQKTGVFGIAVLALFLLNACSIETERCSDVNQDRIYQNLSATYDADTDKTSATAQFTFGGSSGTTLELVENCAVTHDSISLSKQTFLGTSYTGSKSGQTSSHTFTFTDNQSRSYSNSGTIQATAFSSPPTTLSKAGSATVSFTGGALGSGESVTLSLTRTVTSETGSTTQYTSFSEADEGATSVLVPGSQLSEITNGTAQMELRRTVHTDLSEGTDVGGAIYMHYDTAPIDVEITD